MCAKQFYMLSDQELIEYIEYKRKEALDCNTALEEACVELESRGLSQDEGQDNGQLDW